MRKIKKFKNDTLKNKRVEKKFEIWIILRRRWKYWKWCEYIKNIFLFFCMLKIFKKTRDQKLNYNTLHLSYKVKY
jgi:hypothetical protein